MIARVGFLMCVLVALGKAAYEPDLIRDLPGLPYTPKFKMYSGYLSATDNHQLHYWFVESQNNPATDPLLLWMNGGPGCSSMDGLLNELGPFLATGGKNLEVNQYAWNRNASVIFLEAPAGVGYSYAVDGNVTTDDAQVANENLMALQQFFKKFPEFKLNDFYVTGESYGGVYVPSLTYDIAVKDTSIKLKGFVVGNGIMSWASNTNSLMYFAYYHGLFDFALWGDLQKYCCSAKTCNFFNNSDPQCQENVNEASRIVYDIGLNSYSLYMDCYGGVPPHLEQFKRDWRNLFMAYNFPTPVYGDRIQKSGGPNEKMTYSSYELGRKVGDVPPCIDATALTNYLNDASVRKAIHVSDDIDTWAVCSDAVEQTYHRIFMDMAPFYRKLNAMGIRALLYNGDTDMACNFLGAEWFLQDLGFKELRPYGPWYLNDQVAGFYKQYTNIDFVTIRGAGHMVPQWRPRQAFKMLTSFLASAPY